MTRASGRRPARRWAAPLTVAVVVVLVVGWWLRPSGADRPAVVTVAAAGALTCSPNDPGFADGAGTDRACGQAAVSAEVARWSVDTFLGLGDYQYEEARVDDYEGVYERTWGRVRAITRPAIGNQEYKVHDANTFLTYFGDAVGSEKGWYSYDLGPWRAVVLNSNCGVVHCHLGSPQARFLQRELRAARDRCTVVYWHHPRFSTGLHGSDDRLDALWRIVATHGNAIVLSGHEHDYERLKRVDELGNASTTGVRSFVVGTGGQAVFGPDETTGDAARRRAQALSDVRIDDTFGALRLTLRAHRYSWQFVAADGRVLDAGSDTCR